MMPALGLSYLAAVLECQGVEVQLMPCQVLGLTEEQIAGRISDFQPDLVGITTTTENRFQSFHLAALVKQIHPPVRVILGGPHLNATAVDTLRHIESVDGVVVGEGEQTVVDLVSALRSGGTLEGIQGLAYRRGDQVVENPRRPLIPDLDTLPLPARHLEPWDRYDCSMEVPGRGLLPAANMMTSRGCPFDCNFCATPINWGRKVRGLSPERVIAEIEHLIERYRARVIWFYDDTFNYDPRRLRRICDLIRQRDLDIRWYCEVRVDLLSKADLELMVRSGCYYIGFGVETASQRISREIIGKKVDLPKALQVVEWCREFGITANPFFIFSHPTETWTEARETIEVIERIRDRCDVSASILHIYPGTPLEERARREGQLPPDFSWSAADFRRIVVLPAAQGHVPLYVDKLSWAQICQLMFRFSLSTGRVSLRRKIPQVLRSIYSAADIWRYAVMLAVYARLQTGRLWKRFHRRSHNKEEKDRR